MHRFAVAKNISLSSPEANFYRNDRNEFILFFLLMNGKDVKIRPNLGFAHVLSVFIALRGA